jgi:hypothetical protein
VYRGVGCGVVNKDNICRLLKCILVVLDGGNERVDSVIMIGITNITLVKGHCADRPAAPHSPIHK